MINPWHDLPVSPPFVLPQDRAAVEDHNNRVKDKYKFRWDVLPEPYLGNPDADVLLLNGNPGFIESDVAQHSDPTFAAASRANLLHAHYSYPLYLLDPAFADSGGGRWWRSRLKALLDVVPCEAVASRVCVVELVPYHSVNLRRPRRQIPSQEYSNHLVRRFIDRNRPIVWLRGRWQEEVPELREHSRLYRTNTWRCAYLSPGNCAAGYDAVLQELSGERRLGGTAQRDPRTPAPRPQSHVVGHVPPRVKLAPSQPLLTEAQPSERAFPPPAVVELNEATVQQITVAQPRHVAEIRDAMLKLGCASVIVNVVLSAASSVRARLFRGGAEDYVAVVPEHGAQVALYAHRKRMAIALDPERARAYGDRTQVKIVQKTPATWYVEPTEVELAEARVFAEMRQAAMDALERRRRYVAPRTTRRRARRRPPGICNICNYKLLPDGRCSKCEGSGGP